MLILYVAMKLRLNKRKMIKIDEEKLNLIIAKMEEERDEHFKSSAEYIEKDEIINSILDTIRRCAIK